MTLPMGPRTERQRHGLRAETRDNAQSARVTFPSPDTTIHAEARTDDDQWDENDLAREFEKLQDLLDRAEEVADRIVQMFEVRGIRLRRRRRPSKNAGVSGPAPPLKDPIWELLALPGIGHLHFGERVNGKVPVSIDQEKTLSLTQALADLLAVLADDERCGKDRFPPFRSYVDVAQAYSAKRGRAESVRAVIVNISRLRTLLRLANISPRLIEVRNKRVRLRIRRNK